MTNTNEIEAAIGQHLIQRNEQAFKRVIEATGPDDLDREMSRRGWRWSTLLNEWIKK